MLIPTLLQKTKIFNPEMLECKSKKIMLKKTKHGIETEKLNISRSLKRCYFLPQCNYPVMIVHKKFPFGKNKSTMSGI